MHLSTHRCAESQLVSATLRDTFQKIKKLRKTISERMVVLLQKPANSRLTLLQ